MHTLKNKLWKELEMIAMDEKKRTDISKEMSPTNIGFIKEISKAYVYLCKAEKLHCEHMEKHKEHKMADHKEEETPTKMFS